MIPQIIIVLLYYVNLSTSGDSPPRELPWGTWQDRLMIRHLITMTAELCKDTTYKLKHAEKIKDMHSHSINFELGSIAAGIQERFLRMLKIYRQYANLNAFAKHTFTINEFMNAYHVIQGDYNEIRLEKALFYNIVRKHESTQATSRIRHTGKRSTMPLDPRFTQGRKNMKWSRNIDYDDY